MAQDGEKSEYLIHHGSRLADAEKLVTTRPDLATRWDDVAKSYIAACSARDEASRRQQRRNARIKHTLTVIAVAFGMVAAFLAHRDFDRNRTLMTSVRSMADRATESGQRGDDITRSLLALEALDTLNSEWRDTLGVGRFADPNSSLGRRLMPGRPDDDERRRSAIATSAREVLGGYNTAREFRVFAGHKTSVRVMALSPDGKVVMSGSDDGELLVWDVGKQELIRTLTHHGRAVKRIVFSPSGDAVVTTSDDNNGVLWSFPSLDVKLKLTGHNAGEKINSVAFSDDGKFLVTCGTDKTAIVWNISESRQVGVLRGHTDFVNAAVFHPRNSSIVTVSNDATVRVWDLPSLRAIKVLHGHRDAVVNAVFSRTDDRMVSISFDGKPIEWRTDDWTALAKFEGNESGVSSAEFSPEGKTLLFVFEKESAQLYGLEQAPKQPSGDADDQTRALPEYLATHSLDAHSEVIRSGHFNHDGTLVVTAADDNSVRVWDVLSGRLVGTLRGHLGPVIDARFSNDGRTIITASEDKTVRLWRLLLRSETVLPHDDSINSVSFSPRGDTIATVASSHVYLWAANGRKITELEGHRDQTPVWRADFNFDGSKLVTSGDDTTVVVWTRSGDNWEQQLPTQRVLRGHKRFVSTARFDSPGQRVVSSSGDKTAIIWDVEKAVPIKNSRGAPR